MSQRFDVFSTGRSVDKFSLYESGEYLLPFHLRPCRIRILMLVDATISFSHAYFGLSAVLDTLRDNPEFFVKFDITRAHRQTDLFKPDPATQPVQHERYGPHFENFRFDQLGFDINKYDQVWVFGFYGEGGPNPLSDAELEILSRWMDQGGGLFATGDHYNLGAALCSRIPRARTMRKWTVAQGVPLPTGLNRHDTLLKGHDDIYTFDDESDDVPMPIRPRYYPLWSWSPFRHRRAPHPILCGTDGVINILPDHPHEGQVFEDADVVLTQTIDFGTYTGKPEYPTVSGVQTRPEVIAHASVLNDHTNTSDHNKFAANARTFGVIGAYNGHAANVGRVVVDSTWHHWFDVNLTGRPVVNLDSEPHDATNPKTLGFFASAAGTTAFARIQNYFRNVAMWLAGKAKQRCMFLRATWGCILRYPLIERLRTDLAIWELGESARDVIGRRAGQCTLRWWIIDIFPLELREIFEERPIPDPDPCLTCPPFELFEIYALGGITQQLLTLAYRQEAKNASVIDETAIAASFVEGLNAGVKQMNATFTKSLNRSREFSRKATALSRVEVTGKLFLETETPARKEPVQTTKPSGAKPKSSKKTRKSRR